MGHTTTTRYPNHAGDIDRAWLVEQLPKAKYPNALLEIALHPYYSSSLCNFAHVTDDVLIDFVLGEDTLSAGELFGLVRGLSNLKYESADFLMLETLSFCSDAQRIQRAKEIMKYVDQKYSHPAMVLTTTFLNLEEVPTSAVDNAERFLRWANWWDEWAQTRSAKPKYRKERLNNAE